MSDEQSDKKSKFDVADSIKNAHIKLKQNIRLILVVLLVVSLLALGKYNQDRKAKISSPEIDNQQAETVIEENITKEMDINSTWRTKNEITQNALKKEVKSLGDKLTAKDIELKNLMGKLQQIEESQKNYFQDINQIKQDFASNNVQQNQTIKDIKLVHNDLSKARKQVHAKPLKAKEMVVGGTVAKGMLISGTSISTSPHGTDNPYPLNIVLVNDGQGPNGVKIKLKGCNVTAAAVGNLSAERVMARIETLNCYNHATDLNEVTRISGYVAGKDNKHGIKGTVVSRDAEFLRKAALVGILESAGRAVAPASPQMMNPLTNSAITAPDSKMKRLQNDMSQGSSDTIGRVADYYMKTANNIFPVIEINGGQEVDIVFTKSVFRNNIKHQIDEYLD